MLRTRALLYATFGRDLGDLIDDYFAMHGYSNCAPMALYDIGHMGEYELCIKLIGPIYAEFIAYGGIAGNYVAIVERAIEPLDDQMREFVLEQAVKAGNLGIVAMLLARGIRATGTAINTACFLGQSEIIRLLLKHGAPQCTNCTRPSRHLEGHH